MPGERFSLAFGLDAVVTGLVGIALVLGAGYLTDILELPTALLRWAGLSLILFALLVAYVARQRPFKARWAGFVALYNVLWVLASVLLLLVAGLEPTRLGTLFVLFQAAVVALFALWQFRTLRTLSVDPAASRLD